MARATKKPQSRRRAAALKFLSTISFENYNPHADEILKQTAESENFLHLLKKTSNNDESSTFQEFISSKFVETEFSKSYFTPFRER